MKSITSIILSPNLFENQFKPNATPFRGARKNHCHPTSIQKNRSPRWMQNGMACTIILLLITFLSLSTPTFARGDSGNQSQTTLEGNVLTADTQQPIENARVAITGTKTVRMTRKNGVFRLHSNKPIQTITVSCTGFRPVTLTIGDKGNTRMTIRLEPIPLHLQEEVEVTGMPIDEAVQNVVVPEKIVRVKSSQTADALLSDLSGIDVQRTSPGGGKGRGVSIRGFDESRSLILLNGRPLNGSGVMGGDYVDWSSLSTEDIERIEVIRGAKSAEYGNTLGGVINIVTKRGSQKMKTDVQFSYGAFRTTNGMISHKGHIKDRLFYSFSAGNWLTDGYLRNNDVNRKTFSGNLSLSLPGNTILEVGGRITHHERGFIVDNQEGSTFFDDRFPESLSSAGGGPGVQFKGGDYTWGDASYWKNIRRQYDLKLKKRTGSLEMEASLFLNDQDRTEYFYSITDRQKLIFERFAKPEDMTWGWNLKAAHPLKNHRLKYGVEGIHLRYGGGEVRAIDPAYFKKLPTMTAETVEAVKRYSAFIDDRWSLSEGFTLNLGLRYDRYRGRNSQTEGIADVNLEGVSPKFGLTWQAWHDGQIEFSVSKALRFPTCPEYYWYYGGYQPTDRGALSPEDALQFEVGLDQRFGTRGAFNVRVYYYRVDDYIRTIFGYKPSRVVYNVDEARFVGVEVEMRYRLFNPVSFSLNYTYQSAVKEGDVLDMSNQLTDKLTELPEHKLNFRLGYRSNSGIEADLLLRYVGKRSVLMGDLSKPGAVALMTMTDYVTADINAAIPLIRNRAFGWRLKLTLENLFNASYQEVYGFPMPGRRLFAGFDLTF